MCAGIAASVMLATFRVMFPHQYARPDGNLDLVAELAKKYSPSLGRQLDPVTEIVVANGASGVLSNLLAGLLNPGDEVVTIEPSFDLYAAGVETAGGVMKSVALRPDAATQKWQLDFDELEAAFTDRTRALLLNTPQNPTGKVFNRAELERIADIVKRHPGVVVMSDEVYEHMVFDDNAHIPIASLDGMWDRTVTISSAGKTFSCTGWKVGWAIGPAELVRACGVVQSWTCFSGNNPAQLAVAKSMQLASASGYYEELNEMYAKNRDTMCDVLHSVGIKPMVPEGAFFVMGDFSGLDISDEMLRDATPEDRWQDLNRDWKLSRWLTQNVGVAVIPPSAFMKKENWPLVENYVRFAFCKPERDILEARDRLLKAGIQRK
jgi:kynurenine--oxoglutarate transaminase/cysteine-S-conjugate beta-lyase/glutamine--phenylpyruvate transaminase